MKEFFKQELNSLELKTGLKQYERLLERSSWEDDLNELIEILCRVCDQFPYIPDSDKQYIIRQNVISDGEFIGFNARIIYKWLNNAKGTYFKELAHTEPEQNENYKILTGPQRDEWIKRWTESLGDGFQPVPKVSPAEINAEDRPKAHLYPSTPTSVVISMEIHAAWIKANFDTYTGKPLPTWMAEEEWIKSQNAYSIGE